MWLQGDARRVVKGSYPACVRACVQGDLLNAETFGFKGTSMDGKTTFHPCQNQAWSLCLDHTPKTQEKSHVVSHHFAVSMATHIKLHHLLCSPPLSHSPPLSTHLNPIQPNSGIQPCSSPHLLLPLPPAGRLGHTTPAFLPPPLLAPHTLCVLPSFAIMCSPSTLLFPLTHTLSPVLPLLSVPWQCNPIPVGPEPGA